MNIFMIELTKCYFFLYGTKDKTRVKFFQLSSKLLSSGFFWLKILVKFYTYSFIRSQKSFLHWNFLRVKAVCLCNI